MSLVYWLVGGLAIAAILIIIAIITTGNDRNYGDPYDGEGW